MFPCPLQLSEIMTLTTEQLNALVEAYATDIVDGMDVRDLCQFAIDTICDNLDGMTEDELKEEIATVYDEEYLNGLLEQVQ
jgi:hypothetical protein